MSKDFRQLVAEKFPAGIDNLHNLLGTTKNRITRILKENEDNWRDMSAEELRAWADVLGIDHIGLMMEYGCGKRGMSVDEAERFTGIALPHVA